MLLIAGIAATVFCVAGSATGTDLEKREATEMNWDRVEGNWVQLTGNVDERWGNLTDAQLADRVQETYGMTNREDDSQRQLTDWQQRLSEIERAAQ